MIENIIATDHEPGRCWCCANMRAAKKFEELCYVVDILAGPENEIYDIVYSERCDKCYERLNDINLCPNCDSPY